MSNGETGGAARNDAAAKLAKASVCYCFVTWLAPLPNPFISGPGFPVVTSSFFGWTETENDSGDEFWNALVMVKVYDPGTLQVLMAFPQIMAVPHNSYARSRSRTLAWVGFTASWFPFAWPAWPAWPAPIRGATYTGSQALAAVGATECTTVGLACP